MTAPQKVTLYPPAKVNLFLEVTGRRADGFHNIETVMTRIDLRDRLEVEKSEEYSLSCTPDLDVQPEDNLVTKAVRALEQATGRSLPVRVSLHKSIPPGGGLGGGSSDAASALIAVNRIFSLRLEQGKLAEIAGTIGSDVPFFLYPGCALCIGRGNVICDSFLLKPFKLYVVHPGFSVSTKAVYGKIKRDLTSNMKNVHLRRWKEALRKGSVPAGIFNRLEIAAQETDKRVRQVREQLNQVPDMTCVMTGSGSAFAVLPHNRETGTKLTRKAAEAGWQIYCSHAVNI